jgi:predicted ferric reductase
MKNIKGILFIAAIAIITFVLWLLAVLSEPIVPLDRVRHIVAGLALSGFFLNFLLATRNKMLEKWFNGLDKLYIYHKYIAIVTIGLIFVHSAIGELLKTSDQAPLPGALGSLSLGALVVLMGITLFDKRLTYEKWRFTHKLMIVPYTISLFHAYFSSHIPLLRFSALGVWVGLTALIGLSSAIYIIFFYQRVRFQHKGTVTNIVKLGPKIIEWEISLNSPIQFSKGQFIFIKVYQDGFEEAPHPFSISGGNDKKITLTTRVSGDFTAQLYDDLNPGTKVAIEGPYGLMDFSKGKKKQLWVAGGIGITPFMAYLRDSHPDQEIELYYSYQGIDSGVYRQYIEEYQKKNPSFTSHFIDTATMPFLSFEGVSIQEDTSIFMCGPEKMIKGYVNYFRQNLKGADITFEAFKLR